jgi:hypothetical protein
MNDITFLKHTVFLIIQANEGEAEAQIDEKPGHSKINFTLNTHTWHIMYYSCQCRNCNFNMQNLRFLR